MKVNGYTKAAPAIRRERRDMESRGYRQHETDWEIHRGARIGERIVDAKISVCGRYIYTKLSGEYQEWA